MSSALYEHSFGPCVLPYFVCLFSYIN